ncbi:hypothetical protein U1Q18_018856 [Sarracenia purpurea var. burkii]
MSSLVEGLAEDKVQLVSGFSDVGGSNGVSVVVGPAPLHVLPPQVTVLKNLAQPTIALGVVVESQNGASSESMQKPGMRHVESEINSIKSGAESFNKSMLYEERRGMAPLVGLSGVLYPDIPILPQKMEKEKGKCFEHWKKLLELN